MVDKRGESQLNRKLFREVFLKRIHYLLTKRLISERETYTLIKDFFKEYLCLDYEFTAQELQEELKKVYLPNDVRKKLYALLDEVFSVEYNERQLDDEKLRTHLREFRRIIDILEIEEHPDPKLLGILKKVIPGMKSLKEQEEYIVRESEEIVRKRSEQARVEQRFREVETVVQRPKEQSRPSAQQVSVPIHAATPGVEKRMMSTAMISPDVDIPAEIKKVTRQEVGNVRKITAIIKEINAILEKKQNPATRLRIKKLYQQLLALYDSLAEETKAEHYLIISEIYKKLTDDSQDKAEKWNEQNEKSKPVKREEKGKGKREPEKNVKRKK